MKLILEMIFVFVMTILKFFPYKGVTSSINPVKRIIPLKAKEGVRNPALVILIEIGSMKD